MVVDDGHAGKVLAHPLAVGVGHVHANAFDVRFLRPQPPPEALEGIAALAARDVQHGTGLHVPRHGDVLAVGAFVAAVEAADAAELALAELEVIALAALALAPLALGRLRLQPEDYDDVTLPRPHAQRMLRVGPGSSRDNR